MEIKPRLFLLGGKKSRSTPAFKYRLFAYKYKFCQRGRTCSGEVWLYRLWCSCTQVSLVGSLALQLMVQLHSGLPIGKSGSTAYGTAALRSPQWEVWLYSLWYSCTQVSLLGSPALQSETYSLKDHSFGGSSTLHRAGLSEGRLLTGEVSIYNTVTYSQSISKTPNFFSQIFLHQYQTFYH